MSDPRSEIPQPRRYRRFDSMKEYRKTKQNEQKQKTKKMEGGIENSQALNALSRDKPEVTDRTDLENLARSDSNTPEAMGNRLDQNMQHEEAGPPSEKTSPEKTFQEKNSEAGNQQYYEKDNWKNTGEIFIKDDNLCFLPQQEIARTHLVFENEYSDDGHILTEQHHYLVDVDEKRVERGIELAIDVNNESVDPQIKDLSGLKRVPTPFLWNLMEVNPESVGNKGHTFNERAYISEPLKGKKLTYPGRELVGETTLGVSFEKVIVDRETLINMQQKALEYLETQVKEGEMPQAVLDAARGTLRYINNAPEDPHIQKLGTNQKTSGASSEDPKVEQKWWKLFSTDKWAVKGQVGQNENYLFYQDDKLKKQNRQRQVTLAVLDPEDHGGQNLVLTETAWNILRRAPSPVPGYTDTIGITGTAGFAALSSEKPVQDKKGLWKAEAKTLSADSQTLGQMQKLIHSYVEKKVADGRINADILATVDGILKYKHGTLEPARYEGDKLVYRIKGKERRFVEKREPSLVEKLAEEAKKTEGISTIEMTENDIKRYLASKSLPAGASIRNLNLEFNGARTRMTGFVNVPIPFMGGKINFNLELANNQNDDGITVVNYSVDTKSGSLRSRLDQIEPYLRDINNFIVDDINEQLQFHGGFLGVLGVTIAEDGKFAFRVQNSAQAVA